MNDHPQGSPLAAARRARGYSQKQLAELLGVDQSFVSRLEAGKAEPSLRLAVRIQDSLGVDPRELVTTDETPEAAA